MTARTRSVEPKRRGFDVAAYLASPGAGRTVVPYSAGAVVFAQGDPSTDIGYLQDGAIKISVRSRMGKEAVVAILGPGDFFGEGALAGQPVRLATATAVEAAACCASRSG